MQIYNTYYSGIKGVDLYPTNDQMIFLDKCIEGYRISYNWALQKEIDQYLLYIDKKSDRQFLSFIDLQNEFKYFRANHYLLKELPSHTMMNAIWSLVHGYELFFKHKDLNNKPKFKSEYNGAFSSFKPRSEKESFYFRGNYLRIEGLKYQDMIRTGFSPDYGDIKYIDPIIIRNNRTRKYSLNFKVQLPKINIPLFNDPIGVDVNKKYMYACSNGIIIESPDISRYIKHLEDINRIVEKDKIRNSQSNNSLYHLEKRRKIYAHIANIHRNTAYKGSLEIIRCNPTAIILEDLDIKSIMSHSYIADDLQFQPLGISQNILYEQCYKYNIPVIYTPKNFNSNNICSNCGEYKDIKDYKFFVCNKCGTRIHRDINAAINLKNWYTSSVEN